MLEKLKAKLAQVSDFDKLLLAALAGALGQSMSSLVLGSLLLVCGGIAAHRAYKHFNRNKS